VADESGAAFPTVHRNDSNGTWTEEGLTKREWFAGQALAGLLAADADHSSAVLAEMAFRHADAMLKAGDQL
jgi:hypothetical protein